MFKKLAAFLKDLATYTPALLALLLIGSFLLGATTTKLMSLSDSQSLKPPSVAPSSAPNTPQAVKTDVSIGSLPVLGDKNAKITVVEFADFQCPFCERFFKDAEASIKKDYIDTGKVKLAFRNYAFLGPESTWAAEGAYCANEQGKFWEYHDYLYNHQGPENSGAFAKDKLESFAKLLGLNTSQFNSCLETDKYAKEVASDLSDGQKAGVSGTPTTFISGKMITGACPFSTFDAALKAEIAGKVWSVVNCQIN